MNDTLLWYTSRGSGAVSQILLTGVMVLGVLSLGRFETPSWPRFLTAGLHRNLALTAVFFLVLHVLTAVLDPFTDLGWVVAVLPFDTSYRTVWMGLGTIAAELMAAVILISLVRGVLGLRTWRVVHWLAYACWPLAFVHGLGTGSDTQSGWMLAINVFCAGAVGLAVIARLSIGRRDPLDEARKGFRVASTRPNRTG